MKLPGQYFRAGVGAVIVDNAGRVLAIERAKNPGAWQLPQGGLEAGEEPDDAVYREVQEETGLIREQVDLLGRYPELLAYELPPELRSAKTGRGQVQYWFFFRIKDSKAVVSPTSGNEVRSCRWKTWEELIDGAIDFRKPVYRRIREHSLG